MAENWLEAHVKKAVRRTGELWEKGKTFSEVVPGTEPITDLDTYRLVRVKAVGNGLIAATPTREGRTNFVFYPRPEHAAAFASTTHKLVVGPSQWYPGGVWLAQVMLPQREGHLSISAIQGLYKQTPGVLSRSLISKYAGGRVHLLEHAFEYAQQNGRNSVILTTGSYLGHSYKGGKANVRTFIEIGRKYGFTEKVEHGNDPLIELKQPG